MNRRLYFLFPDAVHARHAVDTLLDGTGVDARHIHAIAQREGRMSRLPHPSGRQQHDSAAHIESLLWNGNLLLFGIALLVLIAAIVAESTGWTLAALVVMGTTFVAGFLFTYRIPHVHLDEFRDALAHGEVLVMVDVPSEKVKTVEDYIHRRYPEAVPGGATWTMGAFGL
jgi:hypothetical protein